MICSTKIISDIEESTKNLWQGTGINTNEMVEKINNEVQNILDNIDVMKKKGIDFPMEYVISAMKNLSIALEQQDDYMLADNLFYEWREIFMVLKEISIEIENV